MFVPPHQAMDTEHGGGTSTQPTTQSTTNPMTQTTVLPTTQPTIKPMTHLVTQTTTQPMVQQMIQPMTQPTIQPITQRTTQAMTQPTTQPAVQPTTQPMIQQMTQSMVEPKTQPMIQPTTQPVIQPMIEPTTQPMIQPMIQPTTQPMTQPTTQPMTQPMIQPMTQPMIELITQPIAQPMIQPITQPTIQPLIQPVTQQTIQPMTEPKIQSTTLPTTQPTTQPIFPGNIEPVVGGLILIDSISASSSFGGSFDLPLDLSNAKDDDHKAPIPKLDQESHSSPKPVEYLVDPIQVNSSPKPVEPLVDPTQLNDWNPYGSSVKQSPPVQTMSRPNNIPGYDPNRIPSSIFATKPSSQADWSVASNESLFSIHMGNNSFSRDHAILLGKSEEFVKFDDLISTVPGQLPKSSETNNSPYALPTLMESTSDLENYRHSLSIEEDLTTKRVVDLTPKASMKMRNNTNKETVFAHNSSNISDGRETPTRDGTRTSASSSSSFAFPVLMGDGVSNAPVKSPRAKVQEKIVEKPIEKPKRESQPQPKTPIPKAAVKTKWFSWFHTWSFPRASFCCRR